MRLAVLLALGLAACSGTVGRGVPGRDGGAGGGDARAAADAPRADAAIADGPGADAAADGPAADAAADGPASCAGVVCGRCGACAVVGGVAACTCPAGYRVAGADCVLDPDPCATTTCDADHACVPEAHCQPLGACVATCDCGNCGNCGPDNSDGRWDDWQEYCGNLMASPATLACTRPCPAGEGCLPYSPAICWPMEGCFSL
ncbi:MAG TPA: hypothetical protein VGQ83_24800 [Polyangia bacterium]|jgi:hypothetical protein